LNENMFFIPKGVVGNGFEIIVSLAGMSAGFKDAANLLLG